MRDLMPFNRRNSLRRAGGFEDFYNLLDDFFVGPMNDSFKLDVKDEEDKFVIDADLPGVEKDEINLNLDDGRLTISIERKEEEEKEEKDYVHRERRYSSMSRSLYLGNVKEDEVKAKLNDGVLCIEIPKDGEKETAKKIPIE